MHVPETIIKQTTNDRNLYTLLGLARETSGANGATEAAHSDGDYHAGKPPLLALLHHSRHHCTACAETAE